jgi:hypothetical protein
MKEKCKEKCKQHQWNAVAAVMEPNRKPKPVLNRGTNQKTRMKREQSETGRETNLETGMELSGNRKTRAEFSGAVRSNRLSLRRCSGLPLRVWLLYGTPYFNRSSRMQSVFIRL